MQDLKKDPLVVTGVHATIGAFGGMIMGAVFLYLIFGIGSFLPDSSLEDSGSGPPVEVAMIAGSVVGAILGGVAGLRKAR